MRGSELLEQMEQIDLKYVEEAERFRRKQRQTWLRWAAAAACLCLAAAGVFAALGRQGDAGVRKWNSAYRAEDYFRGSGQTVPEEKSVAPAETPCSRTRMFSDRRAELEQAGVIPTLETHPLFDLSANYMDDGTLHSVQIGWYRRSLVGLEDYSDLVLLAAPKELRPVSDTVDVNMEAHVTVTERDGVRIEAVGAEQTQKRMTWRTEQGWYQVSGSWNDSYADVAALFEWFWAHPLDFTQFPADGGYQLTSSTLAERPDAFRDVLPDFASFGYAQSDSIVVLKDGEPTHAEIHLSNGDDEDFIHWCVESEPDVYELARCMGALETLTQQSLTAQIAQEGQISFLQDGYAVTVYSRASQAVWALVASLQE